MNFAGGRHCKLIRSIAVPLGLWPYRRTILGKINGAIALTITLLCIVAQLAVFITHEFSVDLFLMAVIGIAPPTVYPLKYFFFMWNMEQVKYVFEWIQSDYDSLTDERELRLIEKFAKRGTNIVKSILFCLPIVLVPLGFPVLSEFFNRETFVNHSRSVLIIFNVEYFVDHDRYFYWIMFHIATTTFLALSIMLFTEFTIIYFITHACGLLQIVGDRIERMLESPTAFCDKTHLSMNSQLVATIKLHQRVLEFIQNMNTSILPHYCILIVVGVVSLSINLYIVSRAMLLRKITSELLLALILVISHFLYMGCGNYVSQILLDTGNDLFMKTYCARWHEAPVPVQKMMLYMRQRCMQPTGLVFGGLYTGSHEFFSKLANTSMSYFTVLYSAA